ncbi:hypothetical protein ACWGB8_19745 [Kitasatospora sp. NPDC054939]
MRNGLVQLGAWAAATGAAVALSWLGVHAVLTGEAFEQPTALQLPAPTATAVPEPAGPAAPSSQVQSAERSEAPSAPPATASALVRPSSAPPATAPPPSRRPSSAPSTTSSVRSYLVPGGKVALDVKPDRASLVSATPDPGWQMQVWNGDQWMRIDFSKDGTTANSVFVTWNGHPPDVQTVVR